MLDATLVGDEELELTVFASRDVDVDRTVIYTTIVQTHEWVWWVEFLEVPVGIPWLLLGPAVAANQPPDTATRKYDSYGVPSVLGPINPAQSFFAADIRRSFDNEIETFKTKLDQVRYAMALPVADVLMRWELLGVDDEVMASGSTRTDPFGRVVLGNRPAEAVAVRMTVKETTRVVRLPRMPEPDEPAAEEPSARRASRRRANEGGPAAEASSPEGSPLPRPPDAEAP